MTGKFDPLAPLTDFEAAGIGWAEDCDIDEAAVDVLVQDLLRNTKRCFNQFGVLLTAKQAIIMLRRTMADYAAALRALCESEAALQKATTAPVVTQEGTERGGGYPTPHHETAGDPDDYADEYDQAETTEECLEVLIRLQQEMERHCSLYQNIVPPSMGYLMLFGPRDNLKRKGMVVYGGCVAAIDQAKRVFAVGGHILHATVRAADVPTCLHNAHRRGVQALDIFEKQQSLFG
jgi:hypothetical protein